MAPVIRFVFHRTFSFIVFVFFKESHMSSVIGPFPFEGPEEFGGCLCNRTGRTSSLDGATSFMPAFVEMDLMLANCFDDFGSDAVGHDPNDSQHNFWIDANDPEEDHWADAWELEYGCCESEDEVFEDDEIGTTTSLYVPGTFSAVRFFRNREFKRRIRSGTLVVEKFDRKAKRRVVEREIPVTLRKHRYLDLSVMPHRSYFASGG